MDERSLPCGARTRHARLAAAIATCLAVLLAACGADEGERDGRQARACPDPRAAQARGALVQDIGFEQGSIFPPYDGRLDEGRGEDGTVTVVPEPARTGRRALRLVMPPAQGEAVDEPNRIQLQTPGRRAWSAGDDAWYGISVRLGEDWDLSQVVEDRRFFAAIVSFRWRDIAGDENGPGLGISPTDVEGDDVPHFVSRRVTRGWEFEDGAGEDLIDLGPVVTGRWIDFVIHIRWSTRPGEGVREYWRDGRLMGRSTRQNLPVDSPVVRRTGLYEGTAVDHTRTLYWDNDRVGTSYAEVDPACPSPGDPGSGS